MRGSGDSHEAHWEDTSVQLLVIGKKSDVMTQNIAIEKFHDIFGVRDKLDWAKYGALQYTTTNSKRAASIISRHRNSSAERPCDTC